MNPLEEYFRNLTRRQFFHGAGLGIGSLALSSLLADEANASHGSPWTFTHRCRVCLILLRGRSD